MAPVIFHIPSPVVTLMQCSFQPLVIGWLVVFSVGGVEFSVGNADVGVIEWVVVLVGCLVRVLSFEATLKEAAHMPC